MRSQRRPNNANWQRRPAPGLRVLESVCPQQSTSLPEDQTAALVLQEPYSGHQFRMRPCEMHTCTEANMRAAYSSGEVPYKRDGLLLAHQDSPYVMEGNPFALQWRDQTCSSWSVDTDTAGTETAVQEVVRTRQSCKCSATTGCSLAQSCDTRDHVGASQQDVHSIPRTQITETQVAPAVSHPALRRPEHDHEALALSAGAGIPARRYTGDWRQA